MPTSLKLVIALPYLISLYDPPALALQIGPEKMLDVMSVMAIAWTPDKAYVSLLDHGGSAGRC
jgi:hypothetical protein